MISTLLKPRMIHHVRDGNAFFKVSVQHLANQIYTRFREGKIRYAERMIEYLLNVVEWVLFVDNCVQEDAQGPNVLFFPSVWPSLKNLGRSVI